MSFAGPNPIRDGVRPSKVLSAGDDAELRDLVLDCGFNFTTKNGRPQLIIGNGHTGCRAEYFPRRGRSPLKFVFYHGFEPSATTCGCLIRSPPQNITYEVPEDLAEHAIGLVQERGLETKHASMVVMKLFLGLFVPPSLRGSFPRGIRRGDKVGQTREQGIEEPSPSGPTATTGHVEESQETGENRRGQSTEDE